MLCCAEALGPVRFAGWDGDEPVGRPVTYPFIRCLATEEGQSGNTFTNVAYMLHPDTASEALIERYGKIDAGRDWQTSTRVYLPDGGEIRPSTASSAAKDGGKESFAVADETHLYVLPELRAMHATVLRNLTKRKAAEPWMLETSTMYAPGQDSVAERTHESHQARPSRPLLFDHRQASKGLDECSTVSEVVEQLREAYGDFAEHMDLEATAEDILAGHFEDPDRYFFNRPTHRADDWCDVDQWKAKRRDFKVKRGRKIGLGFDGSAGTADSRIPDSTVLRGVDLETGHLFTVGVWESDGDPEWQPPRADVDAAVREAFARWDVWRMYADPPYWREQLDKWRADFGEDRVIDWPTNRDRQMAAALERLHTAIHSKAGGDLSNDGDPRVDAHYANARRHVKRARVVADDPEARKELVLVRKETPRSALKIDAVIGDALAYEVRGDAIAAGVLKKRKFRARGF